MVKLALSMRGVMSASRYQAMAKKINHASKIWLAMVAAEILLFLFFGFIWFAFFAEEFPVWWLFPLILPFHFFMSEETKEECRCPHYSGALPGFDSDDIFARAPPHCRQQL
jgi:hypothetical protein